MFKRAILIVFLIIFLYPSYSYSWPWSARTETTSSKMNNQKKEFNDLLKTFKVSTNELTSEIEVGKTKISTFKDAILKAVDKNVEFEKVYDEWKKVEANVNNANDKLESLIGSAESFYTAAEEHANTITDENLKKDALNKLNDSQKNYIERLKATKKAIDSVLVVKKKIDNTFKYLEVTMAIKEFDEQLSKAFDEIDKLIPILINELKKLDDDSQKFLNSTLSDSRK